MSETKINAPALEQKQLKEWREHCPADALVAEAMKLIEDIAGWWEWCHKSEPLEAAPTFPSRFGPAARALLSRWRAQEVCVRCSGKGWVSGVFKWMTGRSKEEQP